MSYPTYNIDCALDLHPPTPEQGIDLDLLRKTAKEFATLIQERTPANAEQTLAFRKIEEALFYAIAAVVRDNP